MWMNATGRRVLDYDHTRERAIRKVTGFLKHFIKSAGLPARRNRAFICGLSRHYEPKPRLWFAESSVLLKIKVDNGFFIQKRSCGGYQSLLTCLSS